MGKPAYEGILFIGDPHVASFAPGHRRDEYVETVLEKLAFAISVSKKENFLPVILGDLFHVPRNNPNFLLVRLIQLFRPVIPWVLLGNHDKHEARYTSDVSIAVLEASGSVKLLKDYGIVDTVNVCGKNVLLGASPDWTPLPEKVDRQSHHALALWLTHHNLVFDEIDDSLEPEFRGRNFELKEIPGLDLVVNGHLHRPRASVRKGDTLWLNPGSIVRIIRNPAVREVRPSVTILRFDGRDVCFESLILPHRSFDEVFYPLSETENDAREPSESRFIRGLENLALKRTAEGVGLRDFLSMNLNFSDPIDLEVWKLYEEVIADEQG